VPTFHPEAKDSETYLMPLFIGIILDILPLLLEVCNCKTMQATGTDKFKLCVFCRETQPRYLKSQRNKSVI
jgi:hypothetical protein